MTTHTDRIRQMAQQAKAYADSLDPSGQLAGSEWIEWRDERFAQLVAEDVIRAYYENTGDSMEMPGLEAIRARYSLKP